MAQVVKAHEAILTRIGPAVTSAVVRPALWIDGEGLRDHGIS
jgi:hypothetical protein